MAISVGEKIPSVKIMMATDAGPQEADAREALGAGKVALFSVPGAFTPTCSAKHLPGYIQNESAFKEKGVDKIVCMSVNDAFVMDAWGKDQGAGGKVEMLADGNGDLSRAMGLTMDGKGFGMGERGQRFSAILENGVVTQLNVEEPGAFEVSSAEHMLGQL
ncbi:MAG: peroxiredoxin [Pseudomonadota bacterium]